MHYVSTAVLKGTNRGFEKNLFRTLEIYKRLGIKNIELGSVHEYIPDLKPLFKYKKENDANFIIHTFFPPTKEPMMVNLASKNEEFLKKSLTVAKNAIELCNELESDLYSMHPGLLRDYTQNMDPLSEFMDHDEAVEKTIASLNEIIDYAKNYDVKIAIENMMVKLNVFYDYHDFLKVFKEVRYKKLGLLLDIGHLNYSLKDLNSKIEFVDKLRDKIFEMHIHELDSFNKDHKKLVNPDILKPFNIDTKNIALTLESNGLDEKDIIDSKRILETL